MKLVFISLLVLAVSSMLAVGSLDAVQNNNYDRLAMAIRDDGVLFTYTVKRWQAVEEPCPGVGPYCLQLHNRIDSNDEALVFVVDSRGRLFQTNGEWWQELIGPPDSISAVTVSSVFRVSDSVLQLALLDDAGNLYINDTDSTWSTPFPVFPSAPARDMSFGYDASNDILDPILLGSDGLLYVYYLGEWRSTAELETEMNIQNFATYTDYKTGTILLVAFDALGRMYSNAAGNGLVLTTQEPCPGVGPWDIDLLCTGNGIFDILCLDSTGGLYRAAEGPWITLANSFQDDGSH